MESYKQLRYKQRMLSFWISELIMNHKGNFDHEIGESNNCQLCYKFTKSKSELLRNSDFLKKMQEFKDDATLIKET